MYAHQVQRGRWHFGLWPLPLKQRKARLAAIGKRAEGQRNAGFDVAQAAAGSWYLGNSVH
jgi:hypothetical protein